jgi:hypothetical protein
MKNRKEIAVSSVQHSCIHVASYVKLIGANFRISSRLEITGRR